MGRRGSPSRDSLITSLSLNSGRTRSWSRIRVELFILRRREERDPFPSRHHVPHPLRCSRSEFVDGGVGRKREKKNHKGRSVFVSDGADERGENNAERETKEPKSWDSGVFAGVQSVAVDSPVEPQPAGAGVVGHFMLGQSDVGKSRRLAVDFHMSEEEEATQRSTEGDEDVLHQQLHLQQPLLRLQHRSLDVVQRVSEQPSQLGAPGGGFGRRSVRRRRRSPVGEPRGGQTPLAGKGEVVGNAAWTQVSRSQPHAAQLWQEDKVESSGAVGRGREDEESAGHLENVHAHQRSAVSLPPPQQRRPLTGCLIRPGIMREKAHSVEDNHVYRIISPQVCVCPVRLQKQSRPACDETRTPPFLNFLSPARCCRNKRLFTGARTLDGEKETGLSDVYHEEGRTLD
ncbi:hypothetical protein EYF80_015164 [Liparis tanakae]|uniref:Uncharacterized protein n=1 Tax=Liparis tanakae TaxID=230148 RepID=A0A4Z2I9K0_9TELE|nr:hypothetical protein EYF80_015164 [Liparis tanakae]